MTSGYGSTSERLYLLIPRQHMQVHVPVSTTTNRSMRAAPNRICC